MTSPNVAAPDNGFVTWAGYKCLAYTPPGRIVVNSGATARFDLHHGDQCALDHGKPNTPQRAYLLPPVTLPQNTPVTVSFDLTVYAGLKNDAIWCVLHQLMPTPDKGEYWPSPELALELLTDKGVEYLRFVTRTYPDNPNKTLTKPGDEQCRWPLQRNERYRIAYTYNTAKGQPTGALKVVVDGKVLCDLTGIATGSNDDRGPYPAFGIYREAHATAPITTIMAGLKIA